VPYFGFGGFMELNGPAWEKRGDSVYGRVGCSVSTLPPGVYYAYEGNDGMRYCSVSSMSDTLLDLPGLPTKFILDQISTFWSKKEEYAKYGFIQKRGILLYGPPGCGKTSITNLLKSQIVGSGGIVFLNSYGFKTLADSIGVFRSVEPERPIMTLVEDLESYMASSDGSNTGNQEAAALALYDGERQFNNIIHVATTNKPELLNDRFIRRPGRFDLVIGIHPPSDDTRSAYLKAICNGHLTHDQLDELVEKTEGLSLAYLREIASTYLVLNIPLEETVARLREHNSIRYKSTKTKTGYTVGFCDTNKD
jgi:SpoVK/Ycf46/Vps4 family AAA+-type ATPase